MAHLDSGVAGVLLFWVISCALALAWAPLLIGPLRALSSKARINQQIRPILHAMHDSKQGTPTMGGLLFVINVVILGLLLLWPIADYLILLIVGIVGIGLVGLVDDWLVSQSKRFGGLTPWHKFGLQLLIVGALSYELWARFGLDQVVVPFATPILLGWLMIPLMMVVLLSTINAVNLTDGLDGLAGGVSLFAYVGYLIIALTQGQLVLAAFTAIFLGSLSAFLWFNIYPARFFMGDVGSMTLGLGMGMLAILTGQIVLLPLLGLVFVLETLSVILQVAWRRFFHKKLFSIAPFHHHFEHRGWPETKVSQRFWLLGLMSTVVALVVFFIDRGGV